jgi:hypothetical protein
MVYRKPARRYLHRAKNTWYKFLRRMFVYSDRMITIPSFCSTHIICTQKAHRRINVPTHSILTVPSQQIPKKPIMRYFNPLLPGFTGVLPALHRGQASG